MVSYVTFVELNHNYKNNLVYQPCMPLKVQAFVPIFTTGVTWPKGRTVGLRCLQIFTVHVLSDVCGLDCELIWIFEKELSTQLLR